MPNRVRYGRRMRRRSQPGTAAAPVGAVMRVAAVGLEPSAGRRLAELGLRVGSVLTVLGRTAGDGRVVGVGTGRIALDRRTLGQLVTVPVGGPTG